MRPPKFWYSIRKSELAPFLFIGSGLSQYLGAAIAVGLFSLLSPVAMGWLRILIGGIILCLWRRPWQARGRARWTKREVSATCVFGVVMAAMNLLFYSAIGRIPVGAAVSLEFVGPVAVAVITGYGWRPRIAAILAALGVVSIGGLGIDLEQPSQLFGVFFALAAGATWAGYIVLGQRIAAQRSGIDSLAVGAIAGASVFAPLGLFAVFTSPVIAETAVASWLLTLTWLIPAVIGVAVLSTVFPYSLEQVAMARLGPDTFALLTSLLPVTSTLVGALVLAQFPNAGQGIGLILVSAAVALVRSKPRIAPPTATPENNC